MITVVAPFDVEPDGTSCFAVVEPSWIPGGQTTESSIQFEVPNRAGSVIHVIGRSANALDAECPVELSPVTRWRIEGSSGVQEDAGVPPAPTFGLGLLGQGVVEVAGIGFSDLSNTRTISSGTLTIYCWDEMASPSPTSLTAGVSDTDQSLQLSTACGAQTGDLVQIDGEVMAVKGVENDEKLLDVIRASHGSAASAHDGGAKIYRLTARTFILPFPNDFFGSRASGSYSYPGRGGSNSTGP